MRMIEFDHDDFVKFSKDVFKTLDFPIDYYKGTAVWNMASVRPDLINQAKNFFPWLSGNVAAFFLQPNSHCPIHVDDHDNVSYFNALNVLIEDNNGNHKTYYYDVPGGWNIHDQGTIYGWGDEYVEGDQKIQRVFSHTVTKPTLFNHQQLHSIENFDGKIRIVLCWQIHKDYSIEHLNLWLETNNFNPKVLY
jgi:hypothetical protein